MAHELTVQELEKFSADFNKNPENKVIARSAQRSGVLEASYNDRVQSELTRVFSTELDTDNVTNQKHSGRCWLFATLNVLRHAFGKNQLELKIKILILDIVYRKHLELNSIHTH